MQTASKIRDRTIMLNWYLLKDFLTIWSLSLESMAIVWLKIPYFSFVKRENNANLVLINMKYKEALTEYI